MLFRVLFHNLKEQCSPFCSPLFKNYVFQMPSFIFYTHLKFRIIRLIISGGIAAISCWIAAFSSSVVLGLRLQTSAFRCPQRKKSQAARSGDHAGHRMSPRSEIKRPGNISHRTPIDPLAM
jgi:hypothetical protein